MVTKEKIWIVFPLGFQPSISILYHRAPPMPKTRHEPTHSTELSPKSVLPLDGALMSSASPITGSSKKI